MSGRFERQEDILKRADINFYIHLLGVGGIGSWTALTLAKMGCDKIIAYDNDVVENHNVASQFYKEAQLGRPKLEALKENIKEQTGLEIETETIEEEEHIESGLVIMAIDSMEERIRLGNLYKDRDIYIIDGRMGGLQMEIYCTHASRYLETTVPPSTVVRDRCTARAIGFNCLIIAGLIANFVRLYGKKQIRDGEHVFHLDSLIFMKDLYENHRLPQATPEQGTSLEDSGISTD